MALLFAEGSDHYAGWLPLWRKSWLYADNQGSGRGAGHGFSKGYHFFSPRATIAAGAAYATGAFSNHSIRLCDSGLSRIVSIDIRPDGRVGASSQMGGSASQPAEVCLNLNLWTYHEIKSTIYLIQPDPPLYAATYDIWINERHVLGGVLSPLTLPSPWFEAVDFVGPGGGYGFSIDDVYITDGEVLGDVRIEALHPGADGAHSDWTPSAGVDHYDCVNEAEIDDNTTYLAADAVGAKDSHTLATPDLGETAGLYVWLAAIQDGGTAAKFRPFLRLGGTDYPAADEHAPNDQYIFRGQGYLLNPATGLPWTDADLAALELGIENSS